MNFKQIAIIGVDCISASMALKLKEQRDPPQITGYDTEAVAVDLVRSMGGFDLIERKPGRACKGAELVIVAEPLSAIQETFTAIAPHLERGCLVTDTACLKAPVMRWAEELLPESVSFVGGHIILHPAIVKLDTLEGLDKANADLLKEALYCLTTPKDFVRADVCVELARALETHPYFIDATEHDGLHAGVESLPDLLSVALLQATVDTAGWEEMCNLAGRRFAIATEGAAPSQEHSFQERRAAIILNRENLLLRLNIILEELVRLRDVLSQNDAEKIEEIFAAAVEGRESWIRERRQGMWTKGGLLDQEDTPGLGEQFKQMILGGNIARRLKG